MKDTIRNAEDFADRFQKIRPNDFSRAALEALFHELEELEEQSGEEMEFDPVAISCDWSEYTEAEIRREFGDQFDFSECDGIAEIAEILEDETMVFPVYQHGENEDTLLVLAF